MVQYCPKCKALHSEEELCPIFKDQLKRNPDLLSEAASFTAVAGQYHLASSQALDGVAKGINNLIGSNLSFEGSHQTVRDIQVFRQLNVDAYCGKSGAFTSAEAAKNYLATADDKQVAALVKRLNGTGQEIDWMRFKQGQLSSLTQKTQLLGETTTNAPGVDGETICRFTGKTISQTSIKAAQESKNLGTNVSDILEALKKGTLQTNDTVAGIEGSKDAINKALEKNIHRAIQNGDTDRAKLLKDALDNLKVEEISTPDSIKESTKRLLNKIESSEAHNSISAEQVAGKAMQGAVIGAALGLTISSITNYLKYKNGELTQEEAFREVAIDTSKGALVGGTMGAISCFLPGGPIGFIAGVGIGIYINKSAQNILNEIYGKGAFEAILTSSGFIYGSTVNLSNALKTIEANQSKFDTNLLNAKINSHGTEALFNDFDKIMRG